MSAPMMEATYLRNNRWAIRPAGALGTCGWIAGHGWTVHYVTARSEREALTKYARAAHLFELMRDHGHPQAELPL